MLKDDYERLYTPAERNGIFTRKSKNNNETINRCVKRIIETEMNRNRIKIVPNLDEKIRDFLETNREENQQSSKEKYPKVIEELYLGQILTD